MAAYTLGDLRKAISKNNLSLVKNIVQSGVDFRTSDDLAFRFAAAKGRLSIVKYLYELGSDPTAKDNFAVRHAAMNGHIDVVRFLLDLPEVDPIFDESSFKSLFAKGHLEVIQLLLSRLKLTSDDLMEVFRMAVQQNQPDMVDLLIQQPAFTAHILNVGLKEAIDRSRPDILRQLILFPYANLQEALAYAIRRRKLDALQIISRSPDLSPEIVQQVRATLDPTGIKLLNQFFPDERVTGPTGPDDPDLETAWEDAIENGDLEWVNRLLPTITRDMLDDGIHHAIFNSDVPIMEQLIQHPDADLDDIILVATHANKPDIVRLALRHGIDPRDVQMALDDAVKNGYENIERMLLQYKLDKLIQHPGLDLHAAKIKAEQAGQLALRYMIEEHMIRLKKPPIRPKNPTIRQKKHIVRPTYRNRYEDLRVAIQAIQNHDLDRVKQVVGGAGIYPFDNMYQGIELALQHEDSEILTYLVTVAQERNLNSLNNIFMRTVAGGNMDHLRFLGSIHQPKEVIILDALDLAVRKCHVGIFRYLMTLVPNIEIEALDRIARTHVRGCSSIVHLLDEYKRRGLHRQATKPADQPTDVGNPTIVPIDTKPFTMDMMPDLF